MENAHSKWFEPRSISSISTIILCDNQYGFRKKHSTTHALIDLYDKISSALDHKEHAVGVFLDLSKAFDTVNHEILFDKLYHYGIRGLALDWVESYFTDENKYLDRVFHKNNYNADFIRRNIYRPTEADATNRNPTPVTTVTIPYIKGTSETISRILQPYNIRVAHKPTTTLRHLLTNVKDRDEPNNRQGAVYKIKCSDCQASYIGETARNLNTRLTEHKRATRNGDVNNHIAVHHQLTNHNIDWDTAQCLTYSTNYFQRLTLESWYTNLEQTPLNRCQQLPAPYKRLIHDANEIDKRTSNRPT